MSKRSFGAKRWNWAKNPTELDFSQIQKINDDNTDENLTEVLKFQAVVRRVARVELG